MAAQHGGTVPKLRIDEILPYIDEFGKFQIVFNAILCLLKIPTGNALMMPYFTHKNPPWRCITGSNSNCNLNGTFSPSSKDYLYRCRIPRSDWEYTQAKDYSVVTQVCTQSFSVCLHNSALTEMQGPSLKEGRQEPRGNSLIFLSYTSLEITTKSHTKSQNHKKNHIQRTPKITNH